MTDAHNEYHPGMQAMLELIWGKDFLAPGGAALVKETIAGLDLKGKRVLDIGCGIGGGDFVLAKSGAAEVIGIDIEAPLIARARAGASRHKLEDRLRFQLVEPGPLPFADESFDIVYSSGAFTQIADKRGIFAEAQRVLKPGGWLVAYDWMKGPKRLGQAMAYFFEMEGLTYALDSLPNHLKILRGLGFVDLRGADDGGWYRREAKREYRAMQGRLKPQMLKLLGRPLAEHFIENWRAMTIVLDRRELRPGRYRARKPYPGELPKMAKAAKSSAVKVIRFGKKGPKAVKEKIGTAVSGKPATTTRNFYTDQTGKLVSGIWTSTKGKWPCHYEADEFIYLISGKVRMINAAGKAETFKAGDAWIVPCGFKGMWETVKTLKKYYVILDQAKPKS